MREIVYDRNNLLFVSVYSGFCDRIALPLRRAACRKVWTGTFEIAFCKAILCLRLQAAARLIFVLPERRGSAGGGNTYETCDISAIE
jgi:hypothetical protein